MSLPSFRRASSNTASTRRMVNYGDLNDLHVALPEEEEIEVETLRRTLDQRVEVISGPSARALESAGIRQRPVVTRFTDSRTSSRPYNNGRNSGGFRRPTTSNKRGGRLGGRTTRIGGRFQPKNSILERISFGWDIVGLLHSYLFRLMHESLAGIFCFKKSNKLPSQYVCKL